MEPRFSGRFVWAIPADSQYNGGPRAHQPKPAGKVTHCPPGFGRMRPKRDRPCSPCSPFAVDVRGEALASATSRGPVEGRCSRSAGRKRPGSPTGASSQGHLRPLRPAVHRAALVAPNRSLVGIGRGGGLAGKGTGRQANKRSAGGYQGRRSRSAKRTDAAGAGRCQAFSFLGLASSG